MSRNENTEKDSWARPLWERAASAVTGLRLVYPNKTKAEAVRFGLYRARNADKALSRSILDPSDPMYNKSIWDAFRVSLEPQDWNKRGRGEPYVVVIIRQDAEMHKPVAAEEF